MLSRYLELKQKHRDAILLYRMGDFYEAFFEDAVTLSKALDITLTTRNPSDDNLVPLCGIPYHTASKYVKKLLEKQYKVVLYEQEGGNNGKYEERQ